MQSIFRIQLGTRVPRFKPIQIKTAREKLRKGRGLLEKHQCHVVQVPDSGLLVILLGVNHFEIESVKAVERIIQGVCPDAVCVELCEPRVRSAGLREEGQSEGAPKLPCAKTWQMNYGNKALMARVRPNQVLK